MVKGTKSGSGDEWVPMEEEDRRTFMSVIKEGPRCRPDDAVPVCVESMQMRSASMGPVLIRLEKCEASRHGSEVSVEREEDYKTFEFEVKCPFPGWQTYRPSESLLMNFMYHAGFRKFLLHVDPAGVDHCEKAVDLNFMIETDVVSSTTRNIRMDWEENPHEGNHHPMFLMRHVTSMSGCTNYMSDWLPMDGETESKVHESIVSCLSTHPVSVSGIAFFKDPDVNLSTMQVRTQRGLFDVAFYGMQPIQPCKDTRAEICIFTPDNSALDLDEYVVYAIRYMISFGVTTFTLHNVEGRGSPYVGLTYCPSHGSAKKKYVKKMVVNMTTNTVLIIYGWHGSSNEGSVYGRIEVNDDDDDDQCNKKRKREEAHSISVA